MEVFCPSCRIGYRIPRDKVPNKPRILVCRSCNHAFQARLDRNTTQAPNAILLKNRVRRPSYSKTVLKILREEAALEAKLRD